MPATLGPNGWQATPNQTSRLRVDDDEIGFFQGWQFRAYYELSIAVGAERSFRFTSPVDFILRSQRMDLDSGGLRTAIFVGTVTPAGVWTAVPSFGRNRMSNKFRPEPFYVPQVIIETGGTFTGGTEAEVIRVRSASQSVSAATVGVAADDERGLPAGTYYIRMQPLAGVNDTSAGIYTLAWEERP